MPDIETNDSTDVILRWFRAAVVLALNLVPSLIFPWLLVYHTGLRVIEMLAINATHLAVTVAAGGCAYLAIIALRETLATYEKQRDLILLGAYQYGTDPKVDYAIDKIEEVESFLKQRTEDASPFEETVQMLVEMFADAQD